LNSGLKVRCFCIGGIPFLNCIWFDPNCPVFGVHYMLSHLTTLAPNEIVFQETLAELRHNLEHHIEEEETILFPSAEELFDEVKLEEIGRKMEEMKNNSKTLMAAMKHR
jgi:hypothetical protein